MWKILGPAVIGLALGAQAYAATFEEFDLVGRWSGHCAVAAGAEQGFSIIFASAPGEQPTYTTISSERGGRTTIRSTIIDMAPVAGGRLRLRLRITGGDVDGGPLPSPTTDTFEQVIERVGATQIRLLGTAA